ncbi:MAG: N-acetyltransferase GCN5 [Anaerolineaceae bacterium]|nr:MAG: N-acetyltransferase GCN5 [Anaerolineaceae bacterium]
MKDILTLPGAPRVPGLTFRRFRGEADYPHMAAVITACKVADGIERSTGVEDIARTYRHLENCDPQTDMLFAEVNGQVIAYGRLFWEELLDGIRTYNLLGFLAPEWRRKGIAAAMWEHGERRLREIAASHPQKIKRFFQGMAFESEKGLIALLESRGYQPVRYETYMVRDLGEPFPEAPMPPGLEVRPVEPEHIRPIFDGSNEAFRDHWGARDESEEEFKSHQESPMFRPELWKVAWAGGEMAGVVHNFVDEKENAEYRRKRGYTESICVRRPWRKMGLARSLIVQSMKMFKEMGMTETALSTDSQNISGAFRLYEGCGYRKVKQQIIYRKPLE